MEVVIFGAGSLGSLVGGLLARVHDVTLVGRDPHMATIRDVGLEVTGIDAFVVHPDATTDGLHLAADLAVVTVKTFDTPDAARELATGDYDAVLSLQNGMGNEDILASHLDCAVLAGSTTHGALLGGPGIVEWTGRGDLTLGGWRPTDPPSVERFADAFAESGLDPRVDSDMRLQLWLKLAVNAAINPITALAEAKNDVILTEPAIDLARRTARETATVARADGIDLSNAEAVDRTMTVAETTAANRSSMLVDKSADARTEVDAINGYVVDRAADHGIDVPINRTLAGLVRSWEAGRDLR